MTKNVACLIRLQIAIEKLYKQTSAGVSGLKDQSGTISKVVLSFDGSCVQTVNEPVNRHPAYAATCSPQKKTHINQPLLPVAQRVRVQPSSETVTV